MVEMVELFIQFISNLKHIFIYVLFFKSYQPMFGKMFTAPPLYRTQSGNSLVLVFFLCSVLSSKNSTLTKKMKEYVKGGNPDVSNEEICGELKSVIWPFSNNYVDWAKKNKSFIYLFILSVCIIFFLNAPVFSILYSFVKYWHTKLW